MTGGGDPGAPVPGPGTLDRADASVERGEDEVVLSLVEERLSVATRRVAAGRVRVATRTEPVETVAEAELERYRVEVTRVPVGRVVEVAPLARSEGGVTIIPVIEERLVVVKQLVLTEELHIRHVVERETVCETVTLRRQRATVERFDAEGEPATPEAL